jgi:DNA-binding CsgD family transcriptional regulator
VGLIAEAARTSTLTKGIAKNPETGEDIFLYCYPCATPSQTTGIFVLLKDAEVDVELAEEDQKTMMLVGALWLETMGITNFKDQAGSSDGDPSDLTARQLEILQQIAAGKTNAQIALEQILSESTIRQETVRIYNSLSVGGRVEATKRALHLGLVDRVAV